MFSLKKLNAIFVVMFLAISTWFAPVNAFAENLKVQHLDGSWDGKTIPKNGVCLRRGRRGFFSKDWNINDPQKDEKYSIDVYRSELWKRGRSRGN